MAGRSKDRGAADRRKRKKQAEAALTAAEKREARANAMIAAAAAGLKPEHIEDAVILAMARADGGYIYGRRDCKVVVEQPVVEDGNKPPGIRKQSGRGTDKETFQIKRHF